MAAERSDVQYSLLGCFRCYSRIFNLHRTHDIIFIFAYRQHYSSLRRLFFALQVIKNKQIALSMSQFSLNTFFNRRHSRGNVFS